MAIEFKLPEVSEGVESAEIAEIMVSEGDLVSAGQVVFEVETEKAVAEIDCPHAGRVAKIHVAEGDVVPIGVVLLTIDNSAAGEPDTSATDAESPQAGAAAAAPEADAPSTPQPDTSTAAKTSTTSDRGRTARPAAAAEQVASAAADAPPVQDGRRTRPPAPAGPSTRRLARQLGVDLYQVPATGPGGRITADDVKAFVREHMTQPVGETSSRVAVPALPDFRQFGPIDRQPLSQLAKAAAANLSTSWQVIPHVTNHDLADVTEMEAARKQYLQTDGKAGPKITMTAIVIKAVAAILKELPQFNSSLDLSRNELILKQYCHIGCAVDTPHGLLVPVVRDVDRKTIVDVAADLTDLAGRARNRKLKLEEMQGASITITNLGGIGGTAFTPIVNYPEVAILGLSRSRQELRLVADQLEQRLMMPLSLSYDHRVINGADAARFLVRLSALLADSFYMLVEA